MVVMVLVSLGWFGLLGRLDLLGGVVETGSTTPRW
jgi:hypothetical protein